MPIRRYRVIQAGPKTQLGGVKKGFFRASYQVGIAGVVKNAPMIPASWQTIMLTKSFKSSFLLMIEQYIRMGVRLLSEQRLLLSS